MKKFAWIALACSFVSLFAQAQTVALKTPAAKKSNGWLENFEKAQKEADTFKQPIFALFTGSDWCPWCMKLHSEVLESKAFEKFARENMILFVADFPHEKKVSAATRKQNKKLASQYGVEGFPTVLILDAQGKELDRTGYQQGGGEKYVESLGAMLAKAGIKPSGAATNASPSQVSK